MSEIPEDIMAAAWKAWNDAPCEADEKTIVRHIALALLDERRRLAEAYMHWARKMMEEVEGKE